MQQPLLIYNGKFIYKEELNLGLNRAFRYGDGLFETLRIVNSAPHLYQAHIDRLLSGLKQLKIQFSSLQQKQMNSLIPSLIADNNIEGGILRIFVYRSGGGRFTPEENAANYIVEVEPLADKSFRFNPNGLRIDISENKLNKSFNLNALKTLSSLSYVMSSLEKQERKFDDLLLLNEYDYLVEATASNLFLCFRDEIHTPLISDGCLPGIMRNHVMEIADRAGYIIEERSMTVEDLLDADECFLTNSVAGIRWVVAFKNKRYYNKHSKKIFERIAALA